MEQNPRLFERRNVLLVAYLLLSTGFLVIALLGYQVARQGIRESLVGQNLPLTSSNIYSEIQKDLVRPILISSTMATDTFVRNWVIGGERDAGQMAQYLGEVKTRFDAFSSFFVSDKTHVYYTGDGLFKHVSPDEPRDAWYYRVREMTEPYEINVDPDLANRDRMTIFINYRVFDFAGHYIGATGVGLTVDAVRHLITRYQERFRRTIYIVDGTGNIVILGDQADRDADLRRHEGIGPLVDRILTEKSGTYQFVAAGANHVLHVNYLPELKWFLFVEENEDLALAAIRKTLYVNLAISLVVTLLVLLVTHFALSRYQQYMERLATTDKLTGLLNRQASDILVERLLLELRREPRPTSALLIDIDHFKQINDSHGHFTGDVVLAVMAQRLREGLRTSDIAVRWGGEEFLFILRACDEHEAVRIGEKLREAACKEEFSAGAQETAVTISVGVAEYRAGESSDQWIARADAALYAAKNRGRNRVVAAGSVSDTTRTP